MRLFGSPCVSFNYASQLRAIAENGFDGFRMRQWGAAASGDARILRIYIKGQASAHSCSSSADSFRAPYLYTQKDRNKRQPKFVAFNSLVQRYSV